MARYTVTPWRTQADLLGVRQQLYSSTTGSREMHRHAISRVMAWKLRGNLPHAVESTALLVDAILHHNHSLNSSFSIRAVYSAAFCRFVTGFCDIGRHRERALEPSSMLEIAKQIDMPAEFVALRHEATHEELPGLQRLVDATQKALDWLWTVYWSRISSTDDVEATNARSAALKNEVATALRGYRKVIRDGLLTKQQTDYQRTAHSRQTCEVLITACQNGQRLTDVLTGLMVADGLLLPTDRGLGSSLSGSYLLWDSLIAELQQTLHTEFTYALGLALIHGLVEESTRRPENDADKEALFEWLLHLICPREASDYPSGSQLAAEVMKQCCLHPGYWTRKAGSRVLAIYDDGFREEWSDLFNASIVAQNAGKVDSGAIYEHSDVESSRAAYAEVVDGSGSLIEDGQLDTWTRVIVPPLKPLGMVK